MFSIYCPHCCEHREEEEFHVVGQAHNDRPLNPEALTDAQWAKYLYMRKNTRGLYHEQWVHAIGCRKFFNMTRDTVTYEIKETYKVGEQPAFSA